MQESLHPALMSQKEKLCAKMGIYSIDYVVNSLQKQKMWFLNYKTRKDNVMSLVFNLVTQRDAVNNMGIAKDMRADSSCMTAIAVVTMVFLPGTFTSVCFWAHVTLLPSITDVSPFSRF